MKIGYYVHHHGRGHATRAGVIGAELVRRGHAVTFLGSGPLPGLADADRLTLPSDALGESFPDADGHGRLHFAPLSGDYRAFSAGIARWVADAQPDVMVVDVSVEVTVIVRALGVPVVVVTQPGERTDDAHALGFDLAEKLLALWPNGLSANRHLTKWSTKLVEVGGISRFSPDGVVDGSGTDESTAGLLVGGEGWDTPDLPRQLREALPELTWIEPGERVSVNDVLSRAAIVVTHAGQNAIADVAAHGVRAVVVPQERPFAEQEEMARALAADGFCAAVPRGASAEEIAAAVRQELTETSAEDARRRWAGWSCAGAIERAADVIERAVEGSGARA